jgi:hypothetical protein
VSHRHVVCDLRWIPNGSVPVRTRQAKHTARNMPPVPATQNGTRQRSPAADDVTPLPIPCLARSLLLATVASRRHTLSTV